LTPNRLAGRSEFIDFMSALNGLAQGSSIVPCKSWAALISDFNWKAQSKEPSLHWSDMVYAVFQHT
jgi:hypothetical protein